MVRLELLVAPPPEFDLAWKRRAVAGEPPAVAALIDAMLEPLFRFCFYRLGRNRHLCEDVVQETIVRAIADLPHYDPTRSGNQVFPWLTGLARNEIRRALAREPQGSSLELLWARMDEELREILNRIDSDPLSEAVLEREETREMVNATMAQLPQRYREALEAKYVLRHSTREIAGDQSTTEKAIESLLSRARKAFRETFLALTRNCNPSPLGPSQQ